MISGSLLSFLCIQTLAPPGWSGPLHSFSLSSCQPTEQMSLKWCLNCWSKRECQYCTILSRSVSWILDLSYMVDRHMFCYREGPWNKVLVDYLDFCLSFFIFEKVMQNWRVNLRFWLFKQIRLAERKIEGSLDIHTKPRPLLKHVHLSSGPMGIPHLRLR